MSRTELKTTSESQEEQLLQHERNEAEKRKRLKQLQQRRKLQARLEAADSEELSMNFVRTKPTKTERWGQTNLQHKKISRRMISESRRRYK